MQEELIKRAKELLADGTVARVLGWKAGDLRVCAHHRLVLYSGRRLSLKASAL